MIMVVFTVVPSVRGNYFIQPHLDVSDMEYEVNIFPEWEEKHPRRHGVQSDFISIIKTQL